MPRCPKSSDIQPVISIVSRGHVLEQKKIKGERWASFKHISTMNLEEKMSQRKILNLLQKLFIMQVLYIFQFSLN